jgi:EmrB/QacA subfamily drug resistance transporter
MTLEISRRSRRPPACSGPPGHRGVLVTVCLGVGLATLGTSIVNIALPQVGHDMHTGLTGLQWIANAYMVVYAALLLPAGGLTSRLGRRGLFLRGTAALTVGSICCAAATSLTMLLIGRTVQAIGAAAMVPATLAIVPAEFPDQRQRARAIGFWAGTASVGMAAGPLAGGVILHLAGWRAIFGAVSCTCVAMFILGWRMLSTARHGRALTRQPVDVLGAAAITASLAALSFALIQGRPAGWASPAVLASSAVSVISLCGFIALEHRGAAPLMPLSAWRVPRFIAANMGGISYGLVLNGVLFYLSLFLQQVQGRTALDAGLVFLPLTGAMAVTGPVAGMLTARLGQRAVAAGGMMISAAGIFSLAMISPGESTVSLGWRLAVAGVGMGMTSTPLSGAMMTALPDGAAGFASAMYNTSRQVGGVLGITLLGVILSAGLRAGGSQKGQAFSGGLHLALSAGGLILLATAVACAAMLPGRRPPAAGNRL